MSGVNCIHFCGMAGHRCAHPDARRLIGGNKRCIFLSDDPRIGSCSRQVERPKPAPPGPETGIPVSAPPIDLEQFREVVEFARHSTINKSRRDHADRLLALIDGQANTSNPEYMDRATHRVYRSGGEWLPCYCYAGSDHLPGDEQLGKGEGGE